MIIVAANRGPVSYREAAGELVCEPRAGGLCTALRAVLGPESTWVFAVHTAGDRAGMAAGFPDGGVDAHLRGVEISGDDHAAFYDDISNRMLWFVHHYLWDLVREPVWGDDTRDAWQRYRRVNQRFADAICEELAHSPDSVVLVQDYHLSLVPAMVRRVVPDAAIGYFAHTPFAGPMYLRVLPADIRTELLEGILGADVVGLHSPEWAQNFLDSVRAHAEGEVDQRRARIRTGGRTVRVRAHPMSVDAVELRSAAGTPQVRARLEELDEWRAGRMLVTRVDRLELTKNVLRGFAAFGRMLEREPGLAERVCMSALLVPSRTDVDAYQDYALDCFAMAKELNERAGREVIRIDNRHDPAGALAAFTAYDALFVNPIVDGLNLVSLEGPSVNRNDGAVVLSRNAGSFPRLRRYVVPVDPFDVGATADALHDALTMARPERRRRALGLRRLIEANPPARWLESQLADVRKARPTRRDRGAAPPIAAAS